MEAAPEFVADQATDGSVLDRIRWTKEPHHGRTLFAGARRTPERNRAQAIRILFQVRICSQSVGPGCVAQKLCLEEKLPHRRPNPRPRHYTEYYTPRTRDMIAAKFKVDIERFGYEFAG